MSHNLGFTAKLPPPRLPYPMERSKEELTWTGLTISRPFEVEGAASLRDPESRRPIHSRVRRPVGIEVARISGLSRFETRWLLLGSG
jgi:hypothetical protein